MPRILKIILPLLLFLPFLAEAPRQQVREFFAGPARPALSVLFVGNSLTFTNDLPNEVRRFAAGSPLRSEITVRSITPGSARFSDHWRKGQVTAELRRYRPDILILQGQSTEPLYEPRDFAHYAELLKADADRVRTTTVLFATWARPRGDAYYRDPSSGGSPDEMQTRLNAAYASLALDLGAVLAPVGVAWQRAQRDIPDIELLDGTQHPTPAGSYLAAAVLCRVLLQQSSVSSSYYAGLPKQTALSLQRIANATPFGRKTSK
jgi:hypothetical protein